jgi:hypothetical protein
LHEICSTGVAERRLSQIGQPGVGEIRIGFMHSTRPEALGGPMTAAPAKATDIHAVPARWRERGFCLLVLRELLADHEPPAFAFIEQRLLRPPHRLTRHGVFFGRAFVPDVTVWLVNELGRAALHDDAGKPLHNPRWPVSTWHREPRLWPNGVRSVEWFIDVAFPDNASWAAFRERWHARLTAESEDDR